MSYAGDHLIPLVDEGLGNSAYLADLGGELGDMPARAQDAPGGAVVMCGHGERAMTAATGRRRQEGP